MAPTKQRSRRKSCARKGSKRKSNGMTQRSTGGKRIQEFLQTNRQKKVLDLGRKIRESQGAFEQEVTLGSEGELQCHFNSCTKNGNHDKFIPVKRFTQKDLLEPYNRDKHIVQLAKAQAKITCCIKITYVSENRPLTFPDSEIPFPFGTYRGWRKITRHGTGWVYNVIFYQEKPCPCNECKQSSQTRTEWAMVQIWTASHVIFDDKEADSSTFYCFYDRQEQALSGCPSITGQVMRVLSRAGDDVSRILCATHNLGLARLLKKKCDHYYNLCRILRAKYHPDRAVDVHEDVEDDEDSDDNNEDEHSMTNMNKDNHKPGLNSGHNANSDDDIHSLYFNAKHPLCIITSHPHGQSNMISVGMVIGRKRTQNIFFDNEASYFYTAHTCPGSSGAPVYLLGRREGWGAYQPHSLHDSGEGDNQVNRSAGWEF